VRSARDADEGVALVGANFMAGRNLRVWSLQKSRYTSGFPGSGKRTGREPPQTESQP
jgi:hypothetical protein